MYILCIFTMREVNEKHEPAEKHETGGKKVRERSGRGCEGQCAAFTRNLSQFDCRRRRSSTLVGLFSFSHAAAKQNYDSR